MYRYECIHRIHVCVNVCVCVCARAGVVWPSVYKCASVSTLVHRGVYGCPDAHTHTRIRGPIWVWLQPYPRACAYGWMYMHACIDGSASTGVHRYACICVYM